MESNNQVMTLERQNEEQSQMQKENSSLIDFKMVTFSLSGKDYSIDIKYVVTTKHLNTSLQKHTNRGTDMIVKIAVYTKNFKNTTETYKWASFDLAKLVSVNLRS